MTANKQPYQEVKDKLTSVIGEDWNSIRAQTYIVAKISIYEQSLKEMAEDLVFERAVNARSTEFAKTLIKEVLAQVSR